MHTRDDDDDEHDVNVSVKDQFIQHTVAERLILCVLEARRHCAEYAK